MKIDRLTSLLIKAGIDPDTGKPLQSQPEALGEDFAETLERIINRELFESLAPRGTVSR